MVQQYVKAEYIKNNGNAYIDTGIMASNNIKVEYDFAFTGDGVNLITGTTRPSNPPEWRFCIVTDDFNYRRLYVYYRTWAQYPQINPGRHKISVYREQITVDGVTWGNDTTVRTMNNPRTLLLEAGPSIYSCKIWDNGTLVRDFIPVVRLSDNQACLYDKVTETFFLNQGTGSYEAFNVEVTYTELQQNILEIQDLMIQCNDLSLDILGGTPKPDPLKDYKKLEYIQSTGSQYINTDINIGATTDIEVKFITVQAADGYGRVWGSTSDMRYELADTGGNTRYRISINGTGHEFSTTNDIKIVKMTGNGTVFLNNSQIHNFNKSYTGGEKLWLFWGNSGDWKNVYGRIKLYYAKVWQDNTLVRNYIPVLRKEDNKVGLFDIQNNQFYTDVNNGNFTAGPEIN